VRTKNICFQVDQEAIRAVIDLYERHEIGFEIQVTTIDGHAWELNSSNFFDWAEGVHRPIESITFGSSMKDKNKRALIRFVNARRSLVDFDIPVVWELRGEEKFVQDFDQTLSGLAESIREPFSAIFGPGPLRNALFSMVTFGLMIIGIASLGMPLLFHSLLGSRSPPEMTFRLPNGETLRAVPLQPVLPTVEGSWPLALRYLPYVAIAVGGMFFLLRRLFPVGVFNFGFDRRHVSRNLAARSKLVWGGIIATVIALGAPLLLEALHL
jgi:hypothetical protein